MKKQRRASGTSEDGHVEPLWVLLIASPYLAVMFTLGWGSKLSIGPVLVAFVLWLASIPVALLLLLVRRLRLLAISLVVALLLSYPAWRAGLQAATSYGVHG
jgi:hypothetical protein